MVYKILIGWFTLWIKACRYRFRHSVCRTYKNNAASIFGVNECEGREATPF